MNSLLTLTPVDATPEIMQQLEDAGLILRLTPARHRRLLPDGEACGDLVYESKPEYGPHRLLAVTAGRYDLSRFGSHPDNEELLLIGAPSARPLYFVLAWKKHDEFVNALSAGRVTENDFVCLRLRFNDPDVSFFTLLGDVLHDTVILEDEYGDIPSFYVTECSRMGVRLVNPGKVIIKEVAYEYESCAV